MTAAISKNNGQTEHVAYTRSFVYTFLRLSKQIDPLPQVIISLFLHYQYLFYNNVTDL